MEILTAFDTHLTAFDQASDNDRFSKIFLNSILRGTRYLYHGEAAQPRSARSTGGHTMRGPGAPARRRRAAAAIVAYMIKSASASELPAGAFADRTKLKEAVDEWVRDAVAAKATHGPISGWDVARVDDMSGTGGNPYYDGFFRGAFDSQIGGWDTSKVRNMAYTFYFAKAFNSELAWDTSQVTNM